MHLQICIVNHIVRFSIWNIHNNEFTLFYTFNELDKKLYDPTLLYIPSKQMILMIGGIFMMMHLYFDFTVVHQIKLEYEILLKTQKWNKLFNFNYKDVGATCHQ